MGLDKREMEDEWGDGYTGRDGKRRRHGAEGGKQARFPQRAERRKTTKGKRPEGFEEGYPSPELYVELDDDTGPADQDRDESVEELDFERSERRWWDSGDSHADPEAESDKGDPGDVDEWE